MQNEAMIVCTAAGDQLQLKTSQIECDMLLMTFHAQGLAQVDRGLCPDLINES